MNETPRVKTGRERLPTSLPSSGSSDDNAAGADAGDPQGPRRSALELRKRRSRRGLIAGATALVLAFAGVVYAGVAILGRSGPDARPPASPESSFAPSDAESTMLFGTSEGEDSSEPKVRWVTLLSYDRLRERGAVVYIPAHTATEVPGRGLQPLADAFSTGGARLLGVSTENLLDLDVDRLVELSDDDARSLFDAIGPITVDVPAEVRVAEGANQARVVVGEGRQRLSSDHLVQLLYAVGLGGDDAELGSRHLAFWQALLEAFRVDPSALAAALDEIGRELDVTGGSGAEVARLFGSLAAVPQDAIDLAVLPVDQAGAAGQQLYEVDRSEAGSLLGSIVDPSIADEGARVQVLNGNGEPGIGAEVGKRLVKGGFEVVLSGNARRLDYPTTLIVVYESTAEALAAAEKAKDLLGLGEVQVAAQPQGIVDLTVVVGRDYLRRDR